MLVNGFLGALLVNSIYIRLLPGYIPGIDVCRTGYVLPAYLLIRLFKHNKKSPILDIGLL